MVSNIPGGPQTLELLETPTPEPGPGELRIRIHAAGVNFPDTLIIQDLYQLKPPRPFAPGSEAAGEVEAIGDGVSGFQVGDRVIAITSIGGYATHVLAPYDRVLKIPDNMPFPEAACFLVTYGTSHHALKDRAAMQPGETLLVMGAAGGVGAAAVELGKAMGARVIAAVSTAEKAVFCKGIGADDTIIYPREMGKDAQKAFSNEIKSIAGPNGVDVVYDAVGGGYVEPALRAIAWEGRYLVIGFPAGIPKVPLNLPLLKSCQIVGVFWGAFTQRDPARHQANLAELFQLYAKGQIKPQINATFGLEQAADALEYIQDRKVLGKVVLTMV